MSMRYIMVTVFLFSSVSQATAPEGQPISKSERQYKDAVVAQQTAVDLTSKIISSELKSMLLERTRPEDKEYAKNLIVRWKPMKGSVQNEFDSLVIRNSNGVETMRIKRLPGSADTMILDGRAWKIPMSGSVEKSLRRHLNGSESAALHTGKESVFAMILSPARALAAQPEADAVKAAYVYVTKIENSQNWFSERVTPEEYAALSSGSSIIQNRSGILGSVFSHKFSFDPAVVTCEGTTAKGRAKVEGENLSFESRADGSVILTLDDKKKTKLLFTSKIEDRRAEAARKLEKLKAFVAGGSQDDKLADELLSDALLDSTKNIHANKVTRVAFSGYERERKISLFLAEDLEKYYESLARIEIYDVPTLVECLDGTCSKVDSEHGSSSISSWLKPKDLRPAVKEALNWTPRDSKNSTAKIDWIRSQGSDLELKNSNGLSGRDLRTAQMLLRKANTPDESARPNPSDMLSLRPLGACCGEETCRAQLAAKNVNMVPTGGSGATSK